MPRPKKLDRPRRLEVQIPDSIYSKLQDELFSEVEGRVPHGAASTLCTSLITNWLKSRGAIL